LRQLKLGDHMNKLKLSIIALFISSFTFAWASSGNFNQKMDSIEGRYSFDEGSISTLDGESDCKDVDIQIGRDQRASFNVSVKVNSGSGYISADFSMPSDSEVDNFIEDGELNLIQRESIRGPLRVFETCVLDVNCLNPK